MAVRLASFVCVGSWGERKENRKGKWEPQKKKQAPFLFGVVTENGHSSSLLDQRGHGGGKKRNIQWNKKGFWFRINMHYSPKQTIRRAMESSAMKTWCVMIIRRPDKRRSLMSMQIYAKQPPTPLLNISEAGWDAYSFFFSSLSTPFFPSLPH